MTAACSMVAVLRQDAPNVLRFQFVEVTEPPIVMRPGGHGRSDLGRQVCQSDLGSQAEDHAALDRVAQLTDVSRPGIAQGVRHGPLP